jgi:beta-glucosidase
MRKSLVLLKNEFTNEKPTLPLSKGTKVYIEGFRKEKVAKYAQVVKSIGEADFALLRLKTPHRGRPKELFDLFFHHGELDFSKKKLKHLKKIMASCPTIVDIYLDRPAVIPELDANAAAIIGNFSAEQDIVLEVIFGEFKPTGKLPFELPRSMEAVRNQLEDVPYDSKEPVYKFNHGLSYE